MEKKWFAWINKKLSGPFTEEELTNLSDFNSETEVTLSDGEDYFIPAKKFPELARHFLKKDQEQILSIKCPECSGTTNYRKGNVNIRCDFCGSFFVIAGQEGTLISIECPSCGGETVFSEDRNITKCRYCGVKLLLHAGNRIMRFYIEEKLDRETALKLSLLNLRNLHIEHDITDIKLIFIPFWHYRATLIGIETKKIVDIRKKHSDFLFLNKVLMASDLKEIFTENRLPADFKIRFSRDFHSKYIDKTWIACSVDIGKITLEMKHQSGVLKPFDDIIFNRGKVMMPSEPPDIKEKFKDISFESSETESIIDSHKINYEINKKISLIFSPFWIVDFFSGDKVKSLIIDAVTKETTRICEEKFQQHIFTGIPETYYAPLVVKFQCPYCRYSFKEESEQAFYFCNNCLKLWELKDNSFKEKEYRVIAEQKQYKKNIVYMPLWSFEVTIKDKNEIKTRKDYFNFIRENNDGVNENDPVHFYVHGSGRKNIIKIPKTINEFNQKQPVLKFIETKILNIMPFIIDEESAEKISNLILMNMKPLESLNKEEKISDNLKIELNIVKKEILFLPFYDTGIEFVDGIFGKSFFKNDIQ